jgi:hypothetical protein
MATAQLGQMMMLSECAVRGWKCRESFRSAVLWVLDDVGCLKVVVVIVRMLECVVAIVVFGCDC